MRRLILLAVCLALCGFALWGAQPNPVITQTSLPNGLVGTAYSQTLTATLGYGTIVGASYTFSLASGTPPSGLTLGADGTLAGPPTATGTFNFTVQVASNLFINGVQQPTLTGTQAFTIVIYPALAITTQTANAGTVGASYSQTFAATGGAGAYTWSLEAGAVAPPGLTISTAGVLSGIPTASASYAVPVIVSCQIPTLGTQTTGRTFSVVIAAAPPLAFTGSLSGGVVGAPYSSTLVASGGYEAGTYSFSPTTVPPPPGLTLSSGGTLSGTPTATGTYPFAMFITSSVAGSNLPPLTITPSFTIVIYPALAITPQAANTGTVGVPYSQTFKATGGAGPSTYTWSVLSTPPPGLTLSAAGVLSGTPTAVGTYPFTIQVSSQIPTVGAQTASLLLTPEIAAGPLTITGTLGNGTVGVPYSATLGGSGGYGAGTYTFSVTSGTLPAGIKLSASGALSNTPTVAGTSTFTVQATSTDPNVEDNLPPVTATQSFTVVIYPALAITTQTASSGTVGTPYSQTFTATGGGGPSTYTWSVIGGTPPPGLTFSAAGVLSGTPTASGTYSFSVQVSSQVPTLGTQTASQAFSVVITLSSLTINGNLGGGVVGSPYSATLGATGGYGAGTYTFSVGSGVPPPGLTFSAGGAVSGAPTAAGTFNFTVQVTSTPTGIFLNLPPPPLRATQSFTVVIYPVLTIATQTASSGTVGTPYSQTFTATGGAGPSTYTWSVANGTLPAGLTLSAQGVLFGTPTASGSFSLTVQVTSQ
ncbi:MAG TPA: putative Ig domain-containing protein, partial [Bryobacteraceae bacterium]